MGEFSQLKHELTAASAISSRGPFDCAKFSHVAPHGLSHGPTSELLNHTHTFQAVNVTLPHESHMGLV